MDSYEEQIEAARRSRASSLDLSRRALDALPESLRELTALTELKLADNRLTVLPDWLGDLTSLTRLGLGGNHLTALPDSLGDLTALAWLGLSGNQLTVLPESLRNLTALTWLDLTGNHLSAAPDWLGDLTALTRLDLARNRLTALPDSLGRLTKLTHLSLTGNHLTALPEPLGKLTALTRLDLVGNPLTVPPEPLARPDNGGRLQAWIDDTCTTVVSPADLDAVLDRARGGGVSLCGDDGGRTLFITVNGDRSGLSWEDESDLMLSWGPVPPGAPGGQTAGDYEDALSDPWFTGETDLTEEQARHAGHEFLRTGRRPTNVQWIDKP